MGQCEYWTSDHERCQAEACYGIDAAWSIADFGVWEVCADCVERLVAELEAWQPDGHALEWLYVRVLDWSMPPAEPQPADAF
jgi:hypothetical protein